MFVSSPGANRIKVVQKVEMLKFILLLLLYYFSNYLNSFENELIWYVVVIKITVTPLYISDFVNNFA